MKIHVSYEILNTSQKWTKLRSFLRIISQFSVPVIKILRATTPVKSASLYYFLPEAAQNIFPPIKWWHYKWTTAYSKQRNRYLFDTQSVITFQSSRIDTANRKFISK